MLIVFWNKEDLMYYDKYLLIVKYVDVIFIIDLEKVVSYKVDVFDVDVYVVLFVV